MRSLIILIFFFGIISIMYDQFKNGNYCAPPRVEYRYIPQTFEEQQMERMPIMSVYGDLFYKPSPWTESVGFPGVFFNKKEV